MKTTHSSIILIIVLFFVGCSQSIQPDETSIERDILGVLNAQVRNWNEFNIDGFMQGYLNSDSLRFASGNTLYYGWQDTYDRYQKTYPDPKAMGKLTFSNISITVLSHDAAVVFGRYTLERENDQPTGLFTLLFRKIQEGWYIVHDHTSSAQ